MVIVGNGYQLPLILKQADLVALSEQLNNSGAIIVIIGKTSGPWWV